MASATFLSRKPSTFPLVEKFKKIASSASVNAEAKLSSRPLYVDQKELNQMASKAAQQAASDCMDGLFTLAPVFVMSALLLLAFRVSPILALSLVVVPVIAFLLPRKASAKK